MKKGQIGMMIVIALLIAAIVVAIVLVRSGRSTEVECTYLPGNLPDPNCSPGAILTTDVATICTPGYSASVRDVSKSTKNKVYAMYGIKSHTTGEYEIDHIISLSLGGSNEISNLYPMPAAPYPGYKEKDKAENKLHELVCNNRIPLASAQYMISHNWQSNTGLYQ